MPDSRVYGFDICEKEKVLIPVTGNFPVSGMRICKRGANCGSKRDDAVGYIVRDGPVCGRLFLYQIHIEEIQH